MKKVYDVWFNEGRWIVRCPICASKNKINPPKGRKEIKWYCGGCYPDKLKKKPQMLPNNKVIVGYDSKAQRKAAELANQRNEIYIAVMPEGWKEAQRLLRKRRTPHQGWYPGDFDSPNNKQETLAELAQEQKKHPALWYLQKGKPVADDRPKEAASDPAEQEEVEPLSESIFRSLQ